MATRDNSHQTDCSDNSFSLLNSLVSLSNCGNQSYSAAPSRSRVPDLLNDLISFLAAAQGQNIDFLPITWQPALEVVGKGGTAEIRQSIVNLTTNFVFKRRKALAPHPFDENRVFQNLISEISIHGNTLVRTNPNIMQLEGICWDIPNGTEKVWPVLVFKKTEHGDLGRFLSSKPGWTIDMQERLKLCADVASAVTTLHSCGVIHGDIKPLNVLVFSEASGGYTAKLTDFGYSSQSVSDEDIICVPISRPWNAPEWHDRGFKVRDARAMDAYSFGMLSMWVLFDEVASYPEELLEELKSSDKKLQCLAYQLVEKTAGLSVEQKHNLNILFAWTLARDAKTRNSDFMALLLLLAPTREPIIGHLQNQSDLSRETFQIATSITQFFEGDYRLRGRICASLKKRISNCMNSPTHVDVLQEASFQLAFCYKIGFGVSKDDGQSQFWLHYSQKPQEVLERLVALVKQERAVSGLRRQRANFLQSMNLPEYYREHQILDAAELHYRREIMDISDAIGDHHRITLLLKSILSHIYVSNDRYNEAEKLQLQVMEGCKTVSGLESPDTVISIRNLVQTYTVQGRLTEAEELQNQVSVKKTQAALGHETPTTLRSVATLARCYYRQGQWTKAEELQLRALNGSRLLLGLGHRFTISCMRDLADTYVATGRWREAEELQLQALQMCKSVLGEQHDFTLASMRGLASVYLEQGRYKEAEELQEQVVETRKKVYGSDHSSTLSCIAILASTYRHRGRLESAEELEKEVLEKKKRTLREENPSILTSMANLALTYLSQGRLKEAERLQVQVLEARRRVLGQAHPSVLASTNNLATTYWKQGRGSEAEKLEVHLVEACKSALGEEHPDTLTSMVNLAHTWRSLGREADAVALLTRCVEAQKRVLGASNPRTKSAVYDLNIWRAK